MAKKPDVLGQEPIENPVSSPELKFFEPELITAPYGRGLDLNKGAVEYPNYRFPDFRQKDLNTLEGQPTDYVFGEGPEEILAQNQSFISKLGNAGMKALGTMGNTAIEGTLGLPIGIQQAIQRGDFQASYDNPLTQSLDRFTAWMEKSFPNYYTAEEREMSFGRKLGTANFWADSILKNLGFMAGAYLTGMAGAGVFANLSRLNKLTKTSKVLSEAMRTGKALEGLEGAALMSEIESVGKQLTRLGATQQLTASLMAAKAEAGIESRELGRQLDQDREQNIKDLMASYEEEDRNRIETLNKIENDLLRELNAPVLDNEGNLVQGINYSKETMTDDMLADLQGRAQDVYRKGLQAKAEDEYEKMREGAMNTTFAENAVILTLGNMIQFGKAFGRGYNADRRSLNAIVRDKDILKQNNPFIKRAGHVLYRPVWEMTEEQLQNTSRNSMTDFVGKKSDNAGKVDAGYLLQSHLEGLKEAYGSQQGWEEGFAGFIMGAMGVPGFSRSYSGQINGLKFQGGIWGEIAENRDRSAATERIVNSINRYNKEGHFNNYVKNLIRNMNYEHDKLQYAEEGDIFNYKNAEHNQFISDAINHINAGIFDDFIDRYESLKNAPVDEIKALFTEVDEQGNETNVFDEQNLSDEEVQQKVNDFADRAVEYAKKIRDTKNSIESRFPNLKSTYGVNGAEAITETLIQHGSTIENVDDRIGDLKEVLGPEISEVAEKLVSNPSDENKKELYKLVNEAVAQNPNIKYKELAEDLGKLYERRRTFAENYKRALTDGGHRTIVEAEMQKAKEEEDAKEVANAENKERARWAQKNRDDRKHFKVRVNRQSIQKGGSRTVYTAQVKNADGDLENVDVDDFEFGRESIRLRVGGLWSPALPLDAVPNSFRMYQQRIGEKLLAGEELTDKEKEKYDAAPNAYDKYVEERRIAINEAVESEDPTATEEVYVRVSDNDINSFEVIDDITNKKTGIYIPIEEIIDQIEGENNVSLSQDEFLAIVNRHRRVAALEKMISEREDVLDTLNEEINQNRKRIAEKEREVAALYHNRTKNGIARDINNKRISKNALPALLDGLQKELETTRDLLNRAKLRKEAYQEEISSLKKSLKLIRREYDKPLFDNTKATLDQAESDVKDIDKHIGVLKESESALEKAFSDVKKILLDSLSTMKEILGGEVYNGLFLNTLQELIENDLIRDTYTNQQVIDALNLNFSPDFYADPLLNAITAYEKGLDAVARIEGGLEAVLEHYKNLDAVRKERVLAQQKVKLLEEELNLLKTELSTLGRNFSITDTFRDFPSNIRAANLGLESAATLDENKRTIDVTDAVHTTTGQALDKETKTYPDPRQERWFTVTNRLKNTKGFLEQGYTLKMVTPESDPQYFNEDEISQHKMQKDLDGIGTIKVVLYQNGEPVLEDGEHVFTSIRDLDEKSPYKNDGKRAKVINKYKLPDPSVENAIQLYNNFRTTIAKVVSAGEDLFLKVTGITRGVPITESQQNGQRQRHNIKGRIIAEDASYDDVDAKMSTARELQTATNELLATEKGRLYFEKNGNIVQGEVRELTQSEAEMVLALLQLYDKNTRSQEVLGGTYNPVYDSKHKAQQAKANKQRNTLYGEDGKELSDVSLMQAIQRTIDFSFGNNTFVSKKGNKYIFGFGKEQLEIPADELEENKTAILAKLMERHHQIIPTFLKDNPKNYVEVVKVNDDNTVQTRTWNSYKESVFSDDRDGGPIGTTDLVEEGRMQFAAVNLMYETDSFFDDGELTKAKEDYASFVKEEKDRKDEYKKQGARKPEKKAANNAVDEDEWDEDAAFSITGKTITEKPKDNSSKPKQVENKNVVEDEWDEDSKLDFTSKTAKEDQKKNSVEDEEWLDDENFGDEAHEGKDLGDDPAPFRLEKLRTSTNQEVMKKAEAWFKRQFPELDFHAVRSILEGKAMGMFVDNAVYIWDNAEEGTVFHEAFHVIASLYLGEKGLNQLLEDFRSSTDYSKKMSNIKKAYPELEQQFLELEALAEEFRNYMLNNGKYKAPSKIRAAFQKILDFIKFVILRNRRTVDNTFRAVAAGGFINKRVRAIPTHQGRKFYQRIKGLSSAATKDLLEDMTVRFMMGIRKKAGSIGALMNKEVFQTIDPADIYNEIYEFYDSRDIEEEFFQAVTQNWDSVLESHKLYLQQIGISIRSEGETAEELSEESILESGSEDSLEDGNKSRDSLAFRESITFNTKDGMPNIVRFLFSSLWKTNGTRRINNKTFGGFNTVDFGETYNYVAENLAYTTTFEEMKNKLNELAIYRPELTTILTHLEAENPEPSQDVFALRQAFKQQMAKAKLRHSKLFLSEEGNIYTIDADSASAARQIKNEWKNTFLKNVIEGNSKYATFENGHIRMNGAKFGGLAETGLKTSVEGRKAKIEALRALGIVFSDEERVASDKNFNAAYISFINTLKKEFKNVKEEVENIYTKEASLARPFNLLTDLEAKYSGRSFDPQHLNPENNTVYGIMLYNYITLMRAGMMNGTLHKYLEDNILTANSILANEILEGKVFDIEILEGMSNALKSRSGKRTFSLSDIDKVMLSFNNVLLGKYPLLRPSEKRLEYAIVHDEFIKEDELDSDKFNTIMEGYLVDELNRINTFHTKRSGLTIRNFNQRGGSLALFRNIISSADLRSELEKQAKRGNIIGVIEENREQIQQEIQEYFDRKTQDYIDILKKNKVVVKQKDGYLNVGISFDIHKGEFIKNNEMNTLAKRFAVNYFISNTEQVKLFLGDMTFFKDFFKRTGGMPGTKKLAFTDPETDSFLNRNNKRKDKKVADGSFRLIVKDDPIVRSDYVEQYQNVIEMHALKEMGMSEKDAKAYAEEVVRPYLNIQEADGQGYITLDEYREFLIRTGTWRFDLHEPIFDRLQRGESIPSSEMYYFQPLKPQYFGLRKVDGMSVPVYLKFSLMPLIPSMVEKAQMGSVLEEMIDKKIGIQVFPSSMKVGVPTNEDGTVTPFYNEDGSVNTDMGEAIELDYSFLGIQVDIAPKVKTKTTVGTQIRKLIPLNLFSNGKIRSLTIDGEKSEEKTQKLVNEYNRGWEEIVDLSYQDLLQRFGLTEEKGEFKLADPARLVTTLREEASRRNHSNNVLEALNEILDPVLNTLKYPFDVLPNSDKIQNVMMAMVRESIMRPKVPGGNKIQGSSTGFEFGKRNIAKGEEAVKWGSNELKFYRQDENGRTIAMQVKLPYYYKQYFGGEIGALPLELRTLIGFRIPTDGLHSVDLIEVVDFLPEEAGDLIILPSEIVAKAGSDFDIDKLTIYMNEIYRSREDHKFKTIKDGSTEDLNTQYEDYVNSHTYYALTKSSDRVYRKLTEELGMSEEKASEYADIITGAAEQESPRTIVYKTLLAEVNSDEDLREGEKGFVRNLLNNEYSKIVTQLEKLDSRNQFEIHAKWNSLLKTQQEILSAPETYAQMITPLSTRGIKKVAYYSLYLENGGTAGFETGEYNNWFEGIVEGNEEKLKKVRKKVKIVENEDVSTQTLEWDHILDIGTQFQGGQMAVGMVVNSISNHALSQQADLRLEDTIETDYNGRISSRLNFKTKKGFDHQSLGHATDASGRYISNTLSGIGNAYIDIANDPFIFRLNAKTDVAGVMLMLIRRGVPMLDVGLFMTQPVIRDYLEQARGNYSMMLDNKINVDKDSYSHVRNNPPTLGNMTMDSEGDLVPYVTGETVIEYSAKDLANLIRRTGEVGRDGLNQEEKALELQIMADMLRYRQIAKRISKLIQGSKQDTQLVKSVPDLEVQQEAERRAMKEKNFTNASDLFNKTFLKRIKQVHESLMDAFGNFYLPYSDRSIDILTPIKQRIYDAQMAQFPSGSFSDISTAFRMTNEQFLTFLIQATPVTKGDVTRFLSAERAILLDKNKDRATLAQWLERRKRDARFGLKDNLALKELYGIFDRQGDLHAMHGIGMYNKKKTTLETNLIIEDFRDLFEKNEAAAIALIKASLIQGGVSNSAISFRSIIPFEKFKDLVSPQLLNYIEGGRAPIDLDSFEDQLYRNQSRNSYIVPFESRWATPLGTKPFIRLKEDEFEGGWGMEFYGRTNTPYITSYDPDYGTVLLKNTGKIITKPVKRGPNKGIVREYTVFEQAKRLGDGIYLLQYYPSLAQAISNSVVDMSVAERPTIGHNIYKATSPDEVQETREQQGEFQLEKSVPEDEPTLSPEQEKELESSIKRFLTKAGVQYQPTTEIFDDNGNKVSATAKANIFERILQVIEGKRTISTLPEEATHFFVEMLNDNVMLNGMMSKIENTKVYEDTYQAYKGLYDGDVQKIKKEAIGKLIMAYILQNSGAKSSTYEAWTKDIESNQSLLKKIWNWLKKAFSRLSSGRLTYTVNEFQRAAREITNEDITRLDTGIVGEGSFYQAEEEEKKDTIHRMFDQSSRKIVVDETIDKYIIDGKHQAERVTKKAKEEQGKYYKKEPNKRQLAEWAIDRTTGTMAHGLLSNIVKSHFPKQNVHIDTFDNIDLRSNSDLAVIKNDLEKSLMPIIRETKKMGGYLMSEVKAAHPNLKTAGTIDLIRVRPDGTLDIFDFKTKSTSRVSFAQERERAMQLNDYAEILSLTNPTTGRVGLKVNQKRIIPVTKKYNFSYRKTLINYLMKHLDSFEDGDLMGSPAAAEPSYRSRIYRAMKEANIEMDPTTGTMMQLPIISESTEDKGLDALITNLADEIEIAENEFKNARDSGRKEALAESINYKRELIRAAQLQKDVNGILDAARRDLEYIEVRLGADDFEFQNEFKSLLSAAKIYARMPEFIDTKSLNKQQRQRASTVSFLAGEALKDLEQKYIDIIDRNVEETIQSPAFPDIKEATQPQKRTGWWAYLTQGISHTHHPLLATVKKKVDLALGRARDNTKTTNEKISKAANHVQAFVGKHGPEAFEIFKQVDKDGKYTGRAVSEFKTEFWSELEDALSHNDRKWLMENTDVDYDYYKKKVQWRNEHYERVYKLKYKDFLKEFKEKEVENPEKKAEAAATKHIEFLVEDWKDMYQDRNGEPNIFYFHKPKQTEKWRDPRYTKIMSSPALKEFYEVYKSIIDEARETLPVNITSNFWPNYTASFLELVSTVGIAEAVKGMSKKTIDMLEVGKDPWIYGLQTTDGKEVNQIPMSGIMPVDQDIKSWDLPKVLAVFAESMYRHQELENIHSLALAANQFFKENINGQGELFLDDEGNPRKKMDGTYRKATSKLGNTTAKQFEDFVDMIFYGKSRNDQRAVKKVPDNMITRALGIGGKTVNLMKSLDGGLSYVAIRNLALNFFSPTVNLLQGTTTGLMEGAGGRYYNVRNFLDAARLITTYDKKAWAIINAFNDIPQKEFTSQMRRSMSSVKGTKFTTIDALFKPQELGEEAVQYAVLIAILKGRAGKNFGLTYDDLKLEDGKLKITKEDFDIDKRTTFVSKVKKVNKKIVGNYDPDDRMAAKRYFLGRAVMQHRTWLPAMLENRFGEEKYDFILEENFIGRYRALFKKASWIVFKEMAKKGFFFGNIDSLMKSSGQPEQYVHAMRANLMEATMIAAVYALTKFLAASGDDDPRNFAERYTERTAKRLLLELRSFSAPGQFLQMLQNPAPSLAVANEWFLLMQHIGMETWGQLTFNDVLKEKAQPWKYAKRQFPVAGQVNRLVEFIEDK